MSNFEIQLVRSAFVRLASLDRFVIFTTKLSRMLPHKWHDSRTALAMEKKTTTGAVRRSTVFPVVQAMTRVRHLIVERDGRRVHIRRTFKYRPYRVRRALMKTPLAMTELFMRAFPWGGPRRRWRHGQLIPADDTRPLSLAIENPIDDTRLAC